MSFAGNISSVPFGDILQLICTGKKTGALLLIRGKQKKHIFFRDGQVIYASSEAAEEDRLGQLLVRHGKISPEELATALKKQQLKKRRLGDIIIEMRLVERSEIIHALGLQVEEIIYSIFAWGDGEFQFREGEAPAENAPLTEINTMTVMMEGARRYDEWSKIREALPDSSRILQIRAVPLLSVDEISLSAEDLETLALIDGQRRVDEIIQASVRGEYSAACSVFKLLEGGIIEPLPGEAQGKNEREDLKSVFELVYLLYSHSLARIHREMADVLGEGGDQLFLQPPSRQFIRGLFESLIGGESTSTRESFFKVVDSIPQNLRLHKILSQCANLLQDRIGLVRGRLGERVAERLSQAVRKDVAFLLAQKRSLADRYDIGSEFSESLDMP